MKEFTSEELEDVDERVARRVAAAFGVETYGKSSRYQGLYLGSWGNIQVVWDVEWVSLDNKAAVFKITVGGDK